MKIFIYITNNKLIPDKKKIINNMNSSVKQISFSIIYIAARPMGVGSKG